MMAYFQAVLASLNPGAGRAAALNPHPAACWHGWRSLPLPLPLPLAAFSSSLARWHHLCSCSCLPSPGPMLTL